MWKDPILIQNQKSLFWQYKSRERLAHSEACFSAWPGKVFGVTVKLTPSSHTMQSESQRCRRWRTFRDHCLGCDHRHDDLSDDAAQTWVKFCLDLLADSGSGGLCLLDDVHWSVTSCCTDLQGSSRSTFKCYYFFNITKWLGRHSYLTHLQP